MVGRALGRSGLRPWRGGRGLTLWGFITLVTVVVGCAPAPVVPSSSAPADQAAISSAPVATGPKTLILTQGRAIDGVARTGRTGPEVSHTATAGLTRKNPETLETLPWLAESVPSIENGSWVVNGDQTMVTTYHLRPNIVWHDGTPFSSKDLVFGREVNQDPQVPENNRRPGDLMSRVDTPDDRTLVIYWKTLYQQANSIYDSEMFALPRQILEPVYRSGDYNAYINSPYWSGEMVHLGPFKVVSFDPGRQVEFVAFDQYVLGRPKIDRIIFRTITDPNTTLANVLSNDVDVALDQGLSVEGGITADREWASKGEGTIKFTPLNWTWVNPSATSPIFGWDAPNQAKVRQAMLHAINRPEIVESLSQGKESVVDFPMSPGRRQFATANQFAQRYPHDPRRAEQLLNEAGWHKAADGVLVNDRGERFSVEFRSTNENEQLLTAIAGYLRSAGIESKLNVLTDQQDNSRELRGRWPGLYLARFNVVIESWFDRFHSSRTPNESNEWRSFGVAAWPNPTKDRILEDLNSALDQQQLDQLMVDFVRQFTADLPHLPIKYNAEVTSYRSNVRGVPVRYESGGNTVRTWNIHEWDKV